MAYDESIKAATEILTQYNKDAGIALGAGGPTDPDQFKKDLKQKVGAVSENTLKLVTETDLIDVCKLPPVLARQLARVLTNGTPRDVDPVKDAESSSLEDLVNKFNEKTPRDPYGKRLDYEVGQKRVLIYNADTGILDRPLTIAEAKRLADDKLDDRSGFSNGGQVYKTYRVGDGPSQMRQQHPLYAKEYLASDGTSATGLQWGPVDKDPDWLKFLQLINLAAVDTKECNVDGGSAEKEREIFDYFAAEEKKGAGTAFKSASIRYPKAAAKYYEQKKLGSLSSLKVPLN